MFTEWCYYSNAFTQDECEEIVRVGTKYNLGEGVLGDGGWGAESRTDHEYRDSSIRFINDTEPEANWIFDKIWKIGIKCNKEWYGFHLEWLESMQFTEYIGNPDKPQFYKAHRDVFWVTENPYHRKLSGVLQLTNPTEYEGGELQFSDIDSYPDDTQKNEMKQQGSIIFFPSFIRHEVLPVTSGKRYSLVCWIDGPKWR